MKRLFYELRIIDLPYDQWTHRRPLPILLALSLWATLTAAATLPTRLLIAMIRIEHTIRIVATAGQTGLKGTMERIDREMKIATTAGWTALQVIWGDLAYGIGRVIVGKRMRMNYA